MMRRTNLPPVGSVLAYGDVPTYRRYDIERNCFDVDSQVPVRRTFRCRGAVTNVIAQSDDSRDIEAPFALQLLIDPKSSEAHYFRACDRSFIEHAMRDSGVVAYMRQRQEDGTEPRVFLKSFLGSQCSPIFPRLSRTFLNEHVRVVNRYNRPAPLQMPVVHDVTVTVELVRGTFIHGHERMPKDFEYWCELEWRVVDVVMTTRGDASFCDSATLDRLRNMSLDRSPK